MSRADDAEKKAKRFAQPRHRAPHVMGKREIPIDLAALQAKLTGPSTIDQMKALANALTYGEMIEVAERFVAIIGRAKIEDAEQFAAIISAWATE